MNFLEHLDKEQKDLLVRLPYRIGLWVSQSDQGGGAEAAERELQSLSNILHGFAEEIFSSEDVQRIMAETIACKKEWAEWGNDLLSVPEDCRKVMEFITPHADKKDIAAFTNHLIEIGEAVAISFCEREQSMAGLLKLYIKYKLERQSPDRRRKSFQEYISISAAERKALKSVAGALGAAY